MDNFKNGLGSTSAGELAIRQWWLYAINPKQLIINNKYLNKTAIRNGR